MSDFLCRSVYFNLFFLTLISYTVSMVHLSSIRHVVNSNVSYRVIRYAHTYYSSNILFIIFTVIITKVKSTIIELELPH
jgi:elongation factor P hydroxylase